MKEDLLYEKFVKAIDEKKIIKIWYFNKFWKLHTKICIPYDFWVLNSYRDWFSRYFLYYKDNFHLKKELHIKVTNMYYIDILNDNFCPTSLWINNNIFILLRNR